jgi:hypothetical protein
VSRPERVFQVDQMHCGNWSGAPVAEADEWLAQERATGAIRRYPLTRGWITPGASCPWTATWYVEREGVLAMFESNWDTSG